MKKLFLPILANLLFLTNTFAQNETEAVKAAVDQLFDGMRANDSLLIKKVLYSEVSLKTVITNEAGETVLQKADIRDFIKAVGTKREGVKFDERLSGYDIKIDGDMAMAWTPYSFYFNDKFSHCGVNVFILVRTPDGWKITNITDTRRKTNCN